MNQKTKWLNNLHSGDEIVIDTGDNELPPSIIIAEIEYLPDNSVKILDKDGGKHYCYLKNIS